MKNLGTVVVDGGISELFLSSTFDALMYMDYDYDEFVLLEGLPTEDINFNKEYKAECVKYPEEFDGAELIGYYEKTNGDYVVFSKEDYWLIKSDGSGFETGSIDSSTTLDPEDVEE